MVADLLTDEEKREVLRELARWMTPAGQDIRPALAGLIWERLAEQPMSFDERAVDALRQLGLHVTEDRAVTVERIKARRGL